MKIIFSKRLIKKELGSKPSKEDFEIIRKGFEKGIFDSIKGVSLPIGSKLIKVYATTINGARRIVYLVDTESNDSFFLFFRTKNDKIGVNISIKNPHFKEKLEEYLDILHKDIENGDFQVIDLSLQ